MLVPRARNTSRIIGRQSCFPMAGFDERAAVEAAVRTSSAGIQHVEGRSRRRKS